MARLVTHTGGCHCGVVRFEVDAPKTLEASRCNCSICTKSGFVHLIVGQGDFRLVSGADALTSYSFNTGVAKHTFCKICGVKSFYTPRSHPDGISVNVNCLDPGTFDAVEIVDFDDRNWEQAIETLD